MHPDTASALVRNGALSELGALYRVQKDATSDVQSTQNSIESDSTSQSLLANSSKPHVVCRVFENPTLKFETAFRASREESNVMFVFFTDC